MTNVATPYAEAIATSHASLFAQTGNNKTDSSDYTCATHKNPGTWPVIDTLVEQLTQKSKAVISAHADTDIRTYPFQLDPKGSPAAPLTRTSQLATASQAAYHDHVVRNTGDDRRWRTFTEYIQRLPQELLRRETTRQPSPLFAPRFDENMPFVDKVCDWLQALPVTRVADATPEEAIRVHVTQPSVARPAPSVVDCMEAARVSRTAAAASGMRAHLAACRKMFPPTYSEGLTELDETDDAVKEELAWRQVTKAAVEAYRREKETPFSYLAPMDRLKVDLSPLCFSPHFTRESDTSAPILHHAASPQNLVHSSAELCAPGPQSTQPSPHVPRTESSRERVQQKQLPVSSSHPSWFKRPSQTLNHCVQLYLQNARSVRSKLSSSKSRSVTTNPTGTTTLLDAGNPLSKAATLRWFRLSPGEL